MIQDSDARFMFEKSGLGLCGAAFAAREERTQSDQAAAEYQERRWLGNPCCKGNIATAAVDIQAEFTCGQRAARSASRCQSRYRRGGAEITDNQIEVCGQW